jgi:hypothetical protein
MPPANARSEDVARSFNGLSLLAARALLDPLQEHQGGFELTRASSAESLAPT